MATMFTPQQLRGGGSYSNATKIGNWFEEIALSESKQSDFKKNSDGGSLGLRKLQAKLQKCNQIVPHTFTPDGLIRYGDTIVLRHMLTDRNLACDPYDDIYPSWHKFLVTATNDRVPTARGTFRILRPSSKMANKEDGLVSDDDVVHYGQAFLLACNESLLYSEYSDQLAPCLYLSSTLKNERTTTKTTNRQAVYMTEELNSESVWIITKPSGGRKEGNERFLSVGSPIDADSEVVLSHRATNTLLTVDPKHTDNTDFGVEFESYTDRTVSTGKLHLIISEFKGLTTTNTLSKADIPNNFWKVVMASDPREGVDNRRMPEAFSYADILGQMQSAIKSYGIFGFNELRKRFQAVAKQVKGGADGKIDRADVKECLCYFGLAANNHYFSVVYDRFDFNMDGLITFRDFLKELRGPLPASRARVILSVYNNLDTTGGGEVPVAELRRAYEVKNHPSVRSRDCSEYDARETYFLNLIDISKRVKTDSARPIVPDKVTPESFVDFFTDLSAVIADDDEFEGLFNVLWGNY